MDNADELNRQHYECGVCWYLYNPQQGDDVWQIPPGTAFHCLPGHWRCPNCDAELDCFIPTLD